MKSIVSFCVILILLQTLFLGSLVRMEMPRTYSDRWEETLLDRQVILDPFMMPGKDGLNQNNQNKNEWVPFQCNNTFLTLSTSVHPLVSEIPFKHGIRHSSFIIPIYILNGTLRI
jgi:hypothetical protein